MPRKWKAILFLAVVGLFGFAAYAVTSGIEPDWITVGYASSPATPDDGTILIADEGGVVFDGTGSIGSVNGPGVGVSPSSVSIWAEDAGSGAISLDSDQIDLWSPSVVMGQPANGEGRTVLALGDLVGVIADQFISYTNVVSLGADDDGGMTLIPNDDEADPPVEASSSLYSNGEARLYATDEEDDFQSGVSANTNGQVTMANQTGTALYISADGDVVVQFGPTS